MESLVESAVGGTPLTAFALVSAIARHDRTLVDATPSSTLRIVKSNEAEDRRSRIRLYFRHLLFNTDSRKNSDRFLSEQPLRLPLRQAFPLL